MTKHRKTKEKIVQSTMRIPYSLWQRINHVADMQRLSMAQTVERALYYYCSLYGEMPVDFDFGESSPPHFHELEWQYALNQMKKRAEETKRAERKRKGEMR